MEQALVGEETLVVHSMPLANLCARDPSEDPGMSGFLRGVCDCVEIEVTCLATR